ncbi:unnamed protein product [Hymenolepis diminuta]|uniref:Uncharacterized protein n=1 Tax=Hymenolepis diminuta TaxID=6216 RepID=A0A564Y814_HYMDI|nr:unnamed protein product [Hymenolepis diminuta]
MARVKPAYLDKLVTKSITSVFHSNPPDKETEKPILVSRSGRHIPSVSSATSYSLPKSMTLGLNRTITMNQFIARHFVALTYYKAGRRLKDEFLRL